MRKPKLSQRDRRAVLLGAAILVPGLFWALAAQPYLAAVKDARERLEADRGLLQREQEVLAAADRYPAEFQKGADRLIAAAPRLVGGDDDGAASAAFAGYVRRLARMGAANVLRIDPASTRDAGGGVTALPLEVSGESDLEGLLTFLQMLESGPKLVHVEQLRLEASGQGAPAVAQPGYAVTPFVTGMPGAAQPEVISFRFTATAFTLAQPDTAAAAGRSEAETEEDG